MINRMRTVDHVQSVHAYDAANARLLVRDHYPATSPNTPTVIVSVHAILDAVKRDLCQAGAWINIIGYARTTQPRISMPRHDSARSEDRTYDAPSVVEATLIWSAAAVRIEAYHRAVTAYQQPLGAAG